MRASINLSFTFFSVVGAVCDTTAPTIMDNPSPVVFPTLRPPRGGRHEFIGDHSDAATVSSSVIVVSAQHDAALRRHYGAQLRAVGWRRSGLGSWVQAHGGEHWEASLQVIRITAGSDRHLATFVAVRVAER